MCIITLYKQSNRSNIERVHGFLELEDCKSINKTEHPVLFRRTDLNHDILYIVREDSLNQNDIVKVIDVETGNLDHVKKIFLKLYEIDSVHSRNANITALDFTNFSAFKHVGHSVSYDVGNIRKSKTELDYLVQYAYLAFNDKVIDLREQKSFTHACTYEVNHSIIEFFDVIDRYVNRNHLILCPDFQRGHVWTEKQQIMFIEHVLRGGSVPPIYFNHPGWMGDFKGDFVCVDGLQRITALCKFSQGELKVFGGYTIHQIKNISIVNTSVVFKVNKLKTRREVLQWYYELNTNMVAHSQEELDKVMNMIEQEDLQASAIRMMNNSTYGALPSESVKLELNKELFESNVNFIGNLATWNNYKHPIHVQDLNAKVFWRAWVNEDKLIVTYTMNQDSISHVYKRIPLENKSFEEAVFDYWSNN